jgi:hypothetical protein
VHDTLDFFQTSAKELLTAIILFVLYGLPEERKNLANVRSAVLNFGETLKAMANCPHTEVRLIANRYMEMEGKVRDSINRDLVMRGYTNG